jgi:hypothetical protein
VHETLLAAGQIHRYGYGLAQQLRGIDLGIEREHVQLKPEQLRDALVSVEAAQQENVLAQPRVHPHGTVRLSVRRHGHASFRVRFDRRRHRRR